MINNSKLPTPADILKLGSNEPLVSAHLHLWMTGELTWEQALMGMILALSEKNTKLTQLALDGADEALLEAKKLFGAENTERRLSFFRGVPQDKTQVQQ